MTALSPTGPHCQWLLLLLSGLSVGIWDVQVTEIPSIFEQFPLQCSPAVDISTRGATAKIAAFKGYLRPDAGAGWQVSK